MSPPRSATRRGAWKCNTGLGKGGGALSLDLIVEATGEEVNRVYYKPRHKPRLRRGGVPLQDPALWCLYTRKGANQVQILWCTRGIWNPPQGEANRDNPEGNSGFRSALLVDRLLQRLMPRGVSHRGHLHFLYHSSSPLGRCLPQAEVEKIILLGATCMATRRWLCFVSVRGRNSVSGW